MQQSLELPVQADGNFEFFESLIRSDDHRVAASAFGVLRFAGAAPAQVEKLLRYGVTHLKYAIRTAFASDALKPYWPGGTAKKLAELDQPRPTAEKSLSRQERQFDRQKGLQTVTVGTIPERLLYTRDAFKVKAGQPVKLVFKNPDATEHNLLILDAGTPVAEMKRSGLPPRKSRGDIPTSAPSPVTGPSCRA